MSRRFLICLSCTVVMVTCQNNYDGERNLERDGEYPEREGVNSLSETIPGEADADYPTFTRIPKTAFSCEGRTNWAYYADIETDCQVFHVCDSQFSKLSFICPIGSVFNQRLLICDWWYKTGCTDVTVAEVVEEDDFNNQGSNGRDQTGFDLNIVSSDRGRERVEGGNSVPSSNTNALDQKILSRTVSGSRKQFPPARDQFIHR